MLSSFPSFFHCSMFQYSVTLLCMAIYLYGSMHMNLFDAHPLWEGPGYDIQVILYCFSFAS